MLDVGCGNGLDSGQLAARSACRRIVASDLSLGMVRTLQPWAPSAAAPIDLVLSDVAALPYRDGCAEVALAMHMLYHVPDVPGGLRELRRVLRRGGVLLASTNSARSMGRTMALLDDAVSAVVGRRVTALPELGFTLESGGAQLEPSFPSIERRVYRTTLSIPVAEPVVAVGARSVRDPVIATVGELDWDAVVAGYRRVDEVIARDGAFEVEVEVEVEVEAEAGVFVCRL